MYITAKRVENGFEKGRAVYYKSDSDIQRGDYVKADFKGNVQLFRVQRVNCEPPEFECKSIIEKTESEETGVAIETKITPAEIADNFDTIKGRIAEALVPYKNIVVTEDTLAICKEKKSELSSMARQLDDARKAVKNEFMKPYNEFETKCKELKALIEEVAFPISEGIKEFRELDRQEKKSKVEDIIEKISEEENLPETYRSRIEIPDTWLAKSKSVSAITLEIQREVSRLKVVENADRMKMGTLQDMVSRVNDKIKSQKLTIADFPGIENMKLSEGIEKIQSFGEAIFRAENAEKPQKVKPEQKADDELLYTADFTITGTLTQLRDVKAYLSDNSIIFHNTNAVELQN